MLIDAGAKVGVRTADLGNTPLILAARRAGNSRTVRLLLERGAGASERDEAGISPIMAGAASGDLETVRLLLDAGAKAGDFPETNHSRAATRAAGYRTPLMWAAFNNDVPMVRLLLERGADPNQTTLYGSPLSQACWNDGVEAARILIDRGAKVDARDAFADFTPLHWAAGSETLRPDLVKLLLASGADPNAAGGGPVEAFEMVPQTPRLIAERRGRSAIVEALAAAGAKEPPRPEKIVTPHRSLPEELDDSTVIAAAEKALAALQATAASSRAAFLRHVSKQDCVSCHQQYLPMAAVGHARNRSIRFDREAAGELIDAVVTNKSRHDNRELIAQTIYHPDAAHGFGYELLGLAAEGVPPGAVTDGVVHHLVTIQASDGRWITGIPRPPIESSDVTATALAIRGLKSYGWRGRKEEFAASIEHARRWLRTARPQRNEEACFQLLGLHWAGEPAETMTALVESLRHQQRKDGGWAQLPTLESDAYATGRGPLRPRTIPEGSDGRPGVAARAAVPPGDAGGGRDLARGAAGLPLPADDEERLPAPPRLVDLGGGDELGGPGVDAGRAGRGRPGPARGRATAALGSHAAGRAEGRLRATDQAAPGTLMCRLSWRREAARPVPRRWPGCDPERGASGEAAIVPGRSEESPLVDYVSGKVPDEEMPPRAQRERFPALRADEVALLRAWIDQGAEWPKGVSLASPKVGRSR